MCIISLPVPSELGWGLKKGLYPSKINPKRFITKL